MAQYKTTVSSVAAKVHLHGMAIVGGCSVVALFCLVPAVYLLAAYAFAELFWFVYLYRERLRFDPPSTTPSMSASERQRIWQNCLTNVPDVSSFIRGWFDMAPLENITMQDCKSWLAWAYWGRKFEELEPTDVDQLLDMVADLENGHGLHFREQRPGEERTRMLAFDREPFQSSHYPVLLYIFSHAVLGTVTNWMLKSRNFEQQRVEGVRYWVRRGDAERNGKAATPIVFAHGVGIGLLPYLSLIDGLVDTGATVILLDMPWVSFKVCSVVPVKKQMLSSLRQVLRNNGCDRAAFIGHSYGTVICSWAVTHAKDVVASVTLVDPLVFCLNLSTCLHAYVYRKPKVWIESLIRNETYISHFLRRRMWWNESILFAQDVQVPSLIVLHQKDHSLPVKAIQHHLEKEVETNKACKFPPRVLNIERRGHGGFLSCKNTSQRILTEINAVWNQSLPREQLQAALSRAATAEKDLISAAMVQ